MKVILSKKELEREALAEMRKRPGCETLKAVDVQYSDLRAERIGLCMPSQKAELIRVLCIVRWK
jgi:hypothetical protein